MKKIPTIEDIRKKLIGKIQSENIVKQSNGDANPLFNALVNIPESKMLNTINWLHGVILPKVELHRGADSTEFKQYIALRDSVIWAIEILRAHEKLLCRVAADKLQIEFYRGRVVFLERELTKYTTAEWLLMTESINAYREGLGVQASELLTEKKEV